jgi:uncharacterized RDD family membrane protein YckC
VRDPAGVSLHDGGRWCPRCRSEYRPEFSACADCGVPLVDVEPRPAATPAPTDHEVVEYELADWDEPQRQALELLLVGRDVPHGWDGTLLTVPRVREGEADELIDELEDVDEDGSDDIGGGASTGDSVGEADTGGAVIASPGWRILGYAVDAVVLTNILFALRASPGGRTIAWLFGVGLTAIYTVAPVAVWGRTVGKWLAGTQVVDRDTGRVPTWPAAGLRWLVPAVAAFVAIQIQVGLSVTGPWFTAYLAVIYGGVLWDGRRRGVHDLAARTVVIRRAARAGSGAP